MRWVIKGLPFGYNGAPIAHADCPCDKFLPNRSLAARTPHAFNTYIAGSQSFRSLLTPLNSKSGMNRASWLNLPLSRGCASDASCRHARMDNVWFDSESVPGIFVIAASIHATWAKTPASTGWVISDLFCATRARPPSASGPMTVSARFPATFRSALPSRRPDLPTGGEAWNILAAGDISRGCRRSAAVSESVRQYRHHDWAPLTPATSGLPTDLRSGAATQQPQANASRVTRPKLSGQTDGASRTLIIP